METTKYEPGLTAGAFLGVVGLGLDGLPMHHRHPRPIPFPRDPESSRIATFVPDNLRQDPPPGIDEPVADLRVLETFYFDTRLVELFRRLKVLNTKLGSLRNQQV